MVGRVNTTRPNTLWGRSQKKGKHIPGIHYLKYLLGILNKKILDSRLIPTLTWLSRIHNLTLLGREKQPKTIRFIDTDRILTTIPITIHKGIFRTRMRTPVCAWLSARDTITYFCSLQISLQEPALGENVEFQM